MLAFIYLKKLYFIISFLIIPLGVRTAVSSSLKDTSQSSITYFMIDGLDKQIFEKMISEGKLPFLSKIAQEGLYVENGVSAFPTMTGYGYYPFITGIDAAKSGILGLRWFDRSLSEGNLRNYVGRTNPWMNKDIRKDVKTLFEKVDTAYTASINCFMNRGVKESVITGWDHSAAKFYGRSFFKYIRKIPYVGKELAKNHFQHEQSVLRIAMEQLLKNPRVHFIVFPSPDASIHVQGRTKEYEELLIYIDNLIRLYWEEVEKNGQANSRMLAIISDHGLEVVNKNIDLKRAFQDHNIRLERGNAVNIFTSVLNEPVKNIKDVDAYFVINGNLSAYIYIRNQTDEWKQNPCAGSLNKYITSKGDTFDLINFLSNQEGVEMVVYKDSDTIIIKNAEGSSRITQRAMNLCYEVLTNDVLRVESNYVCKSKNEWLETAQTAYPGAPARIWALFESKSMGEILMTSKEGYDFGRKYEQVVGNYKGGHGGLRASMMLVPYILFGNKVEKKKIHTMTAEDFGKVILEKMHVNTQ